MHHLIKISIVINTIYLNIIKEKTAIGKKQNIITTNKNKNNKATTIKAKQNQ